MDLKALQANYRPIQFNEQPQQQKKKGPGGLAGFLVNSLPAITSGIGAVGGSFLAPVAGTVAGGAAGGALGESIKRKLLGEKQDLGQTAIQAVEGGALSGLGNIAKGAKALTTLGKDATVAKTAATDTGKSFLGKLTENARTQGQQMQGRTAGVSAGTVAGKEIVPQDTERMLATLKSEGIQTGNANNTLRDVTAKQQEYGKQIADHFKTNSAPLHPEDTQKIAENFMSGVKTTDPAYLKEASILAQDLQKGVKSTKDMWDFRVGLDKRIPAGKQAANATITSEKLQAIKDMRSYIANELGDIPGAKQYHDLSDIKSLVAKEANRANNPSGSILGRLLATGPIQKAESTLGKGLEKVAGGSVPAVERVASDPANIFDKVLRSRGIPVKYESETLAGKGLPESKKITLTNPAGSDLASELAKFESGGYGVTKRVGSTPGSMNQFGERGLTPGFTPIQSSPKLPSVELTGSRTSIPLAKTGATEKGIINTPDIYETINKLPLDEVTKQGLLQKLIGAAANPLANPGRTAGAVIKQEAGRGFGIPASLSEVPSDGSDQEQPVDTTGAESQPSDTTELQQQSTDPYAPENIRNSIKNIIAQGGTQKDVAEFLTNAESYNKLSAASGSDIKKTETQRARDDAAQLTKDALAMLEKGSINTGLIGGNLENVKAVFGAADPETLKFNTLASNLRATIAKARAGTAMSDGEKKLLDQYTPKVGDSAQQLMTKLQLLDQTFDQSKAREYGQSYQEDAVNNLGL